LSLFFWEPHCGTRVRLPPPLFCPHRPEMFVPRPVEFMKTETGMGWIQLQIKGRRLDGFLLIAGETGKTGGEGVSDEEVHG
jgi:hypothetical protein